MLPNQFIRRLTAPCVLGSLLLCHAQAQAQTGGVQLLPNNQILEAWQQKNPGGASAALARAEDGATRLEWKLGNATDVYSNSVESTAGQINTPLRSGEFFRNVITGDVRAIHADKSVDYFQAGMTHSNDLAVLSQSRHLINNVQLGRTGAAYQLALGDVAPNFSSLSSMLGVRGLSGQRQLAGVTVSGFTGLVADSWEALGDQVPRYQPIRQVHGLKLEKSFTPSLKTYATAQGYSERETEGQSRSASAGFQYQQGQLSLAGEMATSRFEDGSGAQRSGQAGVLDASWRTGNLSLRAGFHDLGSGFTSLSLAALPGIRETYTGLDWTAASWVTLSTDLRRSRASTLGTVDFASTHTDTDSATVRATINFGREHPAWSLALQQSVSRTADQDGQNSGNADRSFTLNYNTPQWTAAAGAGTGRTHSSVFPDGDAHTQRWSLALGRVFSDAGAGLPATWTVRTNLSALSQSQRLLAGGQSRDSSATLAVTGQRAGWGSFSVAVASGEITRPLGGPALHQRSLLLDASYVINRHSSLKAYLRNTQRNAGDPLLFSRERTAGLQLTCHF